MNDVGADTTAGVYDLVRGNMIAIAVVVVLVCIIVFLMYRPAPSTSASASAKDDPKDVNVEEFDNMIAEINGA